MNENHVSIPVRQVMTDTVIIVERMATIADAIELMRSERVSSLVVARRDDRDEFGLIVVSDIARKVLAQDLAIDRVYVYEIMSKPVLTVHEDMDIKYAVCLLDRFGLSRAVVSDAARTPVGMVTLRDMVFRHAANDPVA